MRVGGSDGCVDDGAADALISEHRSERSGDGVRKVAGGWDATSVERNALAESGVELSRHPPGEVGKGNGRERAWRQGLEFDEHGPCGAGAGELDAGVGKDAGVEQVLCRVAEAVVRHHLAGPQTGDLQN